MTIPATPAVVFEQRCAHPDGAWTEIRLARGARGYLYRLAFGRGEACLLCYEHTGPQGHARILRGRATPYVFRSVEQLRYDFERDLEAL